MRRAAAAGVLLLAAGCASAPRSGPTPDGLAVGATAPDKTAARRQAVESLLPLFLTPAARREKSAAIEAAVFSKLKTFIGREKLSKNGDGVVEVKVDPLSAALQKAGLVRPPGYSSGAEVILLAFGDRAVGPTPTERFAADAFEVALFGRGLQAVDADDQLLKLERPITAKTEKATIEQAAAGGWAWLAAGRVANVARREPQSAAYRGRARLSVTLFSLGASTETASFDAEGEALDVSSTSVVAHAIEQAAQEAALRVENVMTRKRAGHATFAVLVSGYKDPALLRRVLRDLRRAPGVEGAALVSWHGLDEMALLHAYAAGITVDVLAAKLLNGDPALRITAIETEDGRITVAGDNPESEDKGGAED
jgi:hypothetical protein